MRAGFIGIGNMGEPMARNLLRAGHRLTIYNRTPERAESLRAEGARVAVTPADAARDAEVLVTMLADDAALSAVIFGAADSTGAIDGLAPGAIHVSASTISVALSKKLTEAHRVRGQGYVAAPVFGRPEAAASQKLWVVAAGAANEIEVCRPLIDAIGRGVSIVGTEPWLANLVKITGNFTIGAMLETLGEAFALARKSGIEVRPFLDIINEALFHSPLYEGYGGRVATQAYTPAGFRLRLARISHTDLRKTDSGSRDVQFGPSLVPTA
jgi:3-hydroxyisobutyrate dehydrogenase-like beta-hydroxyacid dehydrogenase